MSERRNVFITGASRGIGHATATYFVRQGWRAITCSREVVPEGCPRDERHAHITVDLADTANLGATVGQLEELLDGAPLLPA
ncbi:MAG: SDR family NAD(P)-dependent oxidoreductase [Geminicoccaceae bacterium]